MSGDLFDAVVQNDFTIVDQFILIITKVVVSITLYPPKILEGKGLNTF